MSTRGAMMQVRDAGTTPATWSFRPQPASRAAALQAKLTVGPTGDAFEQEADRVAEQVMKMPDGGSAPQQIQRACAACNEEEEARRSALESAGPTPDPSIDSQVDGLRASGGSPLAGGTLDFMESRFGHDFSKVRVHTGPAAEAAAASVSARAFTVGRDVVFGAGQYSPDSTAGKRLLAHELTHVVQQGSAGPAAASES